MFGTERKRHYPTPIRAPRFCTNRACLNYRTAVKFGSVCNECGHAVWER